MQLIQREQRASERQELKILLTADCTQNPTRVCYLYMPPATTVWKVTGVSSSLHHWSKGLSAVYKYQSVEYPISSVTLLYWLAQEALTRRGQ